MLIFSPPRRCVIALAMRGHRPPPDPVSLGVGELRAALARQGRPAPHRRRCTPALADLIAGTVRAACSRRHGVCEVVIAGASCVYALVSMPECAVGGLCDAVRLIAARRARRALGWPRSERVFTRRATVYVAAEGNALERVRAVMADVREG